MAVFLSDIPLAAHGIDRHNGTLDGQHFKQRWNGDDLVGLLRHFDLPKHEALPCCKDAETMWIAAFVPFLWARRSVLPSMAITSAGEPVSAATQATKQRWN